MKITVEGNVFEGTPEEIKEMMTLLGAEFPESAKPKAEEKESETKPKTVKRKACVGERILITNAGTSLGYYKDGDVFTVCGKFGRSAVLVEELEVKRPKGPYINDDEYEVIISIDGEPAPKFKVGDRARIKTAVGALAGFTAGDVVEIRALGRDSVNDVEVYGKSHGTTGYTTSENLEELTNEFREGDRVKALDDGEFGDVIEGEIGTIDSIIEGDDDSYNIKVKTADDYDYFRPQDLELITEEYSKLKVGDYAKVIEHDNDIYFGGKPGDVVKIVEESEDRYRTEEMDGGDYDGDPWVKKEGVVKISEDEAFVDSQERKPGEFKKGDIVRVVNSPSALAEGTIFEVESVDKCGSVYDDSPTNYVYLLPEEQLELIAPVESRVDL